MGLESCGCLPRRSGVFFFSFRAFLFVVGGRFEVMGRTDGEWLGWVRGAACSSLPAKPAAAAGFVHHVSDFFVWGMEKLHVLPL
jgi:hypothetical protein